MQQDIYKEQNNFQAKGLVDEIELSIIIVNWNGQAVLQGCLESIYRTVRVPFEIIIVDNNSQDKSVSLIESKYPLVYLIKSKENLGFAKGNNIGFKNSRGSHILLLNPDTILLEDTLHLMLNFLKAHPDVGVVGPKAFNKDRTRWFDSRRRSPNIPQAFAELFLFKKLSNWLRIKLIKYPSFRKRINRYYDTSGESEALEGGCFLVRRATYEKLNGFDEGVPMYLDDIDFFYRARKLGLKNYYLSQANMIHFGGHCTKQSKASKMYDILSLRAKLFFFKKHFGIGYVLLYKFLILVSIPYLLLLDLLSLPFFLPSKGLAERGMVIKKHLKYFNLVIFNRIDVFN